MPLEPLFKGFRAIIEKCFARALDDAELSPNDIELIISDQPHGRYTSRAQFLVMASGEQVRITWNGVASLWALSQSVGRLAKRIFESRRLELDELDIDSDDELERGLKGIELARRLLNGEVPAEFATQEHWPKWAPPIVSHPEPGTDDHTGLILFHGALGWILRHELAHVVLKHEERETRFEIDPIGCEKEADVQAAKWLKKELKSDIDRDPSVKPSKSDLALDAQAFVTGIALIWIALFDSELKRSSLHYPPVAERIRACWDTFELSSDSSASELIADAIGYWLAPEERFGPEGGFATSADAMYDALYRLHIHISSLQN